MSAMKSYPKSRWGANARGPALVAVLADWCGHCQTAKPVLEKVAARLGGAVSVYKVNADTSEALTTAWGIQGFPTIFFVTPLGKRVDYEGERTVKAMTDWVCAQSGKCGR